MSEKGALKNKKIEVIALVILAAFIVALGFLVYRYNKNKDFIYEKHLQENVITINSENITLKDFSYYMSKNNPLYDAFSTNFHEKAAAQKGHKGTGYGS